MGSLSKLDWPELCSGSEPLSVVWHGADPVTTAGQFLLPAGRRPDGRRAHAPAPSRSRRFRRNGRSTSGNRLRSNPLAGVDLKPAAFEDVTARSEPADCAAETDDLQDVCRRWVRKRLGGSSARRYLQAPKHGVLSLELNSPGRSDHIRRNTSVDLCTKPVLFNSVYVVVQRRRAHQLRGQWRADPRAA